MKVVEQKIKDLKPYKNNARKHPKRQIEQIAESIKQFGFTYPILIDSDNVVVCGHGRILGAKLAGYKEVPTICLDQLTDEQIRAYRLLDNKTAEQSLWDDTLVEKELEQIFDIDMKVFGFDSISEDEQHKEREVKFKAKEKHLVIIQCKNKSETFKVKDELERLGYECDTKNT